LNRL
jgi:low temperature requirement protein LtrA